MYCPRDVRSSGGSKDIKMDGIRPFPSRSTKSKEGQPQMQLSRGGVQVAEGLRMQGGSWGLGTHGKAGQTEGRVKKAQE